MIPNILTKIFGSRNERLLKQYAAGRSAQINALEPAIAALVRRRAHGARPTRSRSASADGEDARCRCCPEAFAVVREAGKRTLQMRHFDVQLHRRHGAAPRQDRRNAHRRRQDAGRDAARLPQRARRQGRARRHRQRLPRAARRRVDGADLPLPRPDGRRHPVADGPRRASAGRVRCRHHLRHQQRVRLRLPARQHGVRASSDACSAGSTTRSSTKSTRS